MKGIIIECRNMSPATVKVLFIFLKCRFSIAVTMFANRFTTSVQQSCLKCKEQGKLLLMNKEFQRLQGCFQQECMTNRFIRLDMVKFVYKVCPLLLLLGHTHCHTPVSSLLEWTQTLLHNHTLDLIYTMDG